MYIESRHVVHHNVDLFSSDDERNKFSETDNNAQPDQESFKVYTVEDAARKIEAETKDLLMKSASKRSEAYSSPNKISSNKSPHKPIETGACTSTTKKVEESKHSPNKVTNNDKHEKSELYSKYKVPVAKTRLDSVAFSDIVNYESNDDVVSLTGDRKFKRNNQNLSKLGSNNSSTIGTQQPNNFSGFSRPPAGSQLTQEEKVQHIIMDNSQKSKEQIAFINNKLTDYKRDSDVVRIEGSSVATSLATNLFKPKPQSEDVNSEKPSQDYHKRILNAHVPRTNIVINMEQRDAIAEQEIQKEIEKDNVVSDKNLHKEAEANKQHAPLNRISEEVVQSNDTLTSRGGKLNQSGSKQPSSTDKKKTPKKQKGFELKESYNDFVTFDETDQPKRRNRSPECKQSPKHQSEIKHKAKTHRDNEKSRDERKKQKLKQKRQLEKKLKELEELERMVQRKEYLKNKRKWAILTIQRWVKGHLVRKQFEVIKKDACYVRKLRRMLSVAIKKLQNKFIKGIIYQVNRAAKDKLLKLKKQKSEEISSNVYSNSLTSHTPKKANQYSKTFNKQKQVKQFDYNPYNPVNTKIIAFIRGWKIRKIMKCQEISNIIKRNNEVSISIKMSQYNPQTRNFIREYMFQRQQIVEHFLYTLHRLYFTGEWTQTYRKSPREELTHQSSYNSNVVVNLSMPVDTKQNMIQSTSTVRPPLMHLNSVSSQMVLKNPHHTPMRSDYKEINWNSPQNRSPDYRLQASPFRNMNFNPLNNVMAINQNQRYAMPITGASILESRPSDLEASNLINQVLNSGSPISNRLNSLHSNFEQQFEKSVNMNVSSHTPVVPEFQHPQRSTVRETIGK